MMRGKTVTYTSFDEAISATHDTGETELFYPTEYLNSIRFPGFPPHMLELKVGAPVILLRNVNLAGGLCNETRMIVKQSLSKLIEVQIITGTRIGEKFFLHRIPLTKKELKLPFIFKRKQFPIKLCYAMTINKSQGQLLTKIGVYLPEPIFGHRQLYVALSRTTSPHGLKILIKQQQDHPLNTTKNIVFRQFLSLQLLSSSATHYYFDPDIPVARNSQDEYRSRYEQNSPLDIIKERLPNEQDEQNKNNHPLAILLEKNPEEYKGVRFTCEATIIQINTTKQWYYIACSKCQRKVTNNGTSYYCINDGPQPNPDYRYCFKGTISDGTANADFTFFTPAANDIVKHTCPELVSSHPDPYQIPAPILNATGTKHIMQFRYDKPNRAGMIDFTLDKAFPITESNKAITDTPPPSTSATIKEAKKTRGRNIKKNCQTQPLQR